MVEFSYLPSYPPMEREAHAPIEVEPIRVKSNIEAPVFSISEIGQTFPEHDATGRHKSLVQTAEAAIRAGAGTLQLIMMTGPESALGGRFKAYGTEVREALKEVAKASEVKLRGIEMPTSMNNLSGWDLGRNRFSEEIRKRYMDEIRDGIRFAAEVTNGGGIDIVSWEFHRGINDANWNKRVPVQLASGKKVETKLFSAPGEVEIIQLVDKVTGEVSQFRRSEKLHLPKDPKNPDKDLGLDEKGNIKLAEWTWNDFVNNAKTKIDPETGKPLDPEKFYFQEQVSAQKKQSEGWARHYTEEYNGEKEAISKIDEKIKNPAARAPEETLEVLNKARARFVKKAEQTKEAAEGYAQQIKQIEERAKRVVPVSEYAKKRAMASYAEAGVWAHQESFVHGQHMPNPIHVGPEIGWPEYYGSHPQEWVELIKGAREKMKELLTQEFRTDWDGKTILNIQGQPLVDEKGNPVERKDWEKLAPKLKAEAANPYFVKDLSGKKAEEEARKHVKGMFDTSHVGIFLQHFRPDLPWEQRVNEFQKWYMDQIDWLAKENKEHDLIGGIQLVDTVTGAHSHLPPGQGVLPIVDAIHKLKKEGGLKGYLVSEGHEEEKFGEGRILLKTWEAFGANVNRMYFPTGGPAPLQWSRDFSGSYFGRMYSPTFIFGAYAPSNEFKLWSEVPLE